MEPSTLGVQVGPTVGVKCPTLCLTNTLAESGVSLSVDRGSVKRATVSCNEALSPVSLFPSP